jgi:EAL domain-containing protein (putative c-di-GMP-specific phosphodiesterase class I)
VVKLTDAVKRAVQLRRMAEMKRLALELMGRVETRAADKDELSATFERALAGLYVHYQPIVRWSTQSIYGYEVLVRSRESALPHPGALFDAAEALDRVVELGRAIRRVAPSAPDLPKGARLFVNLHPLDLADEMLLERTAPLFAMVDRVILEITERSSLDRIPNVRDRINQLRLAGYTIAVDDLGAGYAGLASFAMLEPDVAKLDMSIVRDIDRLETKRKLVGSMAKLCREMNIALVAEGVETEAERDTVVALGCDLLQGYLLARPATIPPGVNF